MVTIPNPDELPAGILAADESVHLTVCATGPQSKWIAPLLSTPRRVVLVFTSERLLVITSAKRGELASLSECRWHDVEKMRLGRISNRLTLRYEDGRCEVFTLTRTRDASSARDLIASLPHGGRSERGGRQPLCPSCFARMVEATYHCGSCGSVFRDPRMAFRFALWWPGGGYFFLRRHSAGVSIVVCELLFLALIKLTWDLQKIQRIENAWPGTVGIVLAWLILKVTTAMHARSVARELIIDRNPETRSRQIPPVVLAATAREVAVATGSAAIAAAAAANRAAEVVERTATQIAASPHYQRVVTELASAGPRAFLSEDLQDEEREAVEQEQKALVATVRPAFGLLLERGEKILYATRGAMPYSILDYFGSVLLLYFVRRCVYVFTDRRMFVIRVGVDDKPLPTVSAVHYRDVKSCTFAGGFGFTVNMKLTLAYHDGRKETFNRIPLSDLERIRVLLPAAIANAPEANAPRATRGRVHYCTWCGTRLFKGVPTCRSCGARYANRRTALLLALLIPGGGYFYLRMPKLGIADAVLESFLALNAAGLLVGAMINPVVYARPAAIICALFMIEKLVSVRHALDQASEFVGLAPARTFQKPSLRVAKPNRVLNTALLAGGILLILAGGAIRAPLYPLQSELARLSNDLEKDEPRMKAWEKQQKADAQEIMSLGERVMTLGYKARGRRYWTERNRIVIQPWFYDDSLQSQYDQLRHEFESKRAAYAVEQDAYRAAALSYNARLARARELEDRIGGVWFAMLPTEALTDIVTKLDAAD